MCTPTWRGRTPRRCPTRGTSRTSSRSSTSASTCASTRCCASVLSRRGRDGGAPTSAAEVAVALVPSGRPLGGDRAQQVDQLVLQRATHPATELLRLVGGIPLPVLKFSIRTSARAISAVSTATPLGDLRSSAIDSVLRLDARK